MIQPPPGHMGKSPQEIIDATQDELARQRQSSKQQDRLKRARELDEVDRRWRERDEQYQLNRTIQRFEEDRPGLLEGQDAAPRVIEPVGSWQGILPRAAAASASAVASVDGLGDAVILMKQMVGNWEKVATELAEAKQEIRTLKSRHA